MPDKPGEWRSCEAEVGSVMDALRIPAIGHIPVKTSKANHQFPFEGACMVFRGRGFYQAGDRRKYSFEAPAVFYIWPGPWFRFGPDEGTTWEERYICFSGPRVDDWLKWRWLRHPEKPLHLNEPEFIARLHQGVSAAFTDPPTAPLEQAKLEAEQLVYALHRQTLPKPVGEDKLGRLIRKWTLSPEQPVDFIAAAKSLRMSYSGFRQHFARRTRLMPYQFLLRHRIDSACSLLTQTAQPVKSIAYDCGFEFVESFNRAFLRLKGMSPTQYRRQATLFNRATPKPKKRPRNSRIAL